MFFAVGDKIRVKHDLKRVAAKTEFVQNPASIRDDCTHAMPKSCYCDVQGRDTHTRRGPALKPRTPLSGFLAFGLRNSMKNTCFCSPDSC